MRGLTHDRLKPGRNVEKSACQTGGIHNRYWTPDAPWAGSTARTHTWQDIGQGRDLAMSVAHIGMTIFHLRSIGDVLKFCHQVPVSLTT